MSKKTISAPAAGTQCELTGRWIFGCSAIQWKSLMMFEALTTSR